MLDKSVLNVACASLTCGKRDPPNTNLRSPRQSFNTSPKIDRDNITSSIRDCASGSRKASMAVPENVQAEEVSEQLCACKLRLY